MAATELVVRLVSGVLLLLANGVYVMTEFAMTRLRQFDEEEVTTSRTLKLAWSMTEELEIYLTACQLGITVTSILLGVVFEPAVTELIYPITALIGLTEGQTAFFSVTVAVILIQFMHTVWGEQSPTYLGVEKPLWVASIFAPFLYGWAWAIYPVIFLGDYLAKATLALFGVSFTRSWTAEAEPAEEPSSRSELRRRIGELLSKSDRSEERREEVLNALEIETMTTESIMVPREAIHCLDRTKTVQENLSVIEAHHFNRFPLVDGELDSFIGTIYVPTLVSRLDELRDGDVDWKDLAVEAMTVSPDLPVSELVDQFQDREQELALVVEENRVLGLVTSTDAFESILGELRDPFD